MNINRIQNAATHLRVPFSIFLLPVFLLALIPVERVFTQQLVWLFLALHLFIYPSSNAINSYYDQDDGPIGGLEHPPEADSMTLTIGVLFNLIGLAICGLFINWPCLLVLTGYSAVSFAYSYPGIRLKAHPILSTLAVALYQGPVVVLAVWIAAGFEPIHQTGALAILAGSFLLLVGSYPITQLYQIEEDRNRGDHTLAGILGAFGTINLSGTAFLGFAGFISLSSLISFREYWPYLVLAMIPGAIGVGNLLVNHLVRKRSITFKMIMVQNISSSTAFVLAHILYLAIGK